MQKNYINLILSPLFLAVSLAIRLEIAPIEVSFPAGLHHSASVIHGISLQAGFTIG